MSKTLKIFLIIIFLCTVICGISFATSEDTSSTAADESQTTSLDETSTQTSPASTTSSFSNSGITSVTQVSDYSEANLGLNNILNILLIAIGILIILFAIAILIRLK